MADVECLEIHVCKVCGKEHPEPPNKVQFPSRASASCWKCWYPPFHHASIGIVGRLFAQDGQYSPIDGSLGPVLWRWGRGLSAGRSIYIPIYNYLYIYIQYCSATVFVPFGSWQTGPSRLFGTPQRLGITLSFFVGWKHDWAILLLRHVCTVPHIQFIKACSS